MCDHIFIIFNKVFLCLFVMFQISQLCVVVTERMKRVDNFLIKAIMTNAGSYEKVCIVATNSCAKFCYRCIIAEHVVWVLDMNQYVEVQRLDMHRTFEWGVTPGYVVTARYCR